MGMLTHNGRPIEADTIEYENGDVMIRYVDNGAIAIVPKSQIVHTPSRCPECHRVGTHKMDCSQA